MKKIPIALQLYSVREDCAQDLPGTLKAVAEMGYAGVEFAGWHNHSASELKKILADTGLTVAGAHIPIAQFENDQWESNADFNQTLGNPYLIVPGIPADRRQTLDDWRRLAEFFNQLAEKAAARNLRVGFHNHMVEFEELEGRMPWEVFFDAARADVIMQIDTGNALRAGAQAADYLRRYPGRAEIVHLKEHSAVNEKALIGEGDVPWQTIFELSETIGGTKWYVVEEERRPYPPLESVRRSLEALRQMGKV